MIDEALRPPAGFGEAWDVSCETMERLSAFLQVLAGWQTTHNLVAPSTLPGIWTRHVADSLQLLAVMPMRGVAYDLGSGGGFPGIVLAIATADRPLVWHFVESNGKRAAFLRAASHAARVSVTVHPERITAVIADAAATADIVTARALAPLSDLCAYASALLKPDGRAVFPKGRDVESELTAARKSWTFDARLIPSRTDPEGRIVVMTRPHPVRP